MMTSLTQMNVVTQKLLVVSSETKRKVHVPQVSLMMTVFVRRRPNKVLSFVIELDKGLKE